MKKLAKKVLICYLIFLVVSAVSRAESVNGGMSGGGGNSGISKVAGLQNVHRSLMFARGELYFYFQKLKFRPESRDLLFLFAKAKHSDIFSVIEKTRIFINPTGPCFDANKNEVDGSDLGPQDDMICISSFRLAEKLNLENSYAQTLGLVAHEMAHRVGATEAQAQAVQLQIVKDIADSPIRAQSIFQESVIVRNYARIVHDYYKTIDGYLVNPDVACGYFKEQARFAEDVFWNHFHSKTFGMSRLQNRASLLAYHLNYYFLWGVCAIGSDPAREQFEKFNNAFEAPRSLNNFMRRQRNSNIYEPDFDPLIVLTKFTPENYKMQVKNLLNLLLPVMWDAISEIERIQNLRDAPLE